MIGQMLSARKSVRIDARIKKKLQLQKTETRPVLKGKSTKGLKGTDTLKRGRKNNISAATPKPTAKEADESVAASTVLITAKPDAKETGEVTATSTGKRPIKPTAKVLEAAPTSTARRTTKRTAKVLEAAAVSTGKRAIKPIAKVLEAAATPTGRRSIKPTAKVLEAAATPTGRRAIKSTAKVLEAAATPTGRRAIKPTAKVLEAAATPTGRRTIKPTAKVLDAAATPTGKRTAKPTVAATRTSARVIKKAATKTTSEATAKITPKRTAKSAASSDGSDTTSDSSSRLTSRSVSNRTAKRQADEIGTPCPGPSAKRTKTSMTPRTTPRRKQDQRSTSKKKDKTSPIQFDYGVPSPIETERESIDDEDSPNQILAKTLQRVVTAQTKQGQSVRIPLDPPKAFTFKSEQARKLWENATKERADYVKGLIENRDFVPDWMKRQIEGSLELTASQTRTMLTEDKNRRAQGALKYLKLEEKALDLDAAIKSSLRKEFANTDLGKCIDSLEKLLKLSVDPLTLKKYPELAMTPCLLQKYKGALAQWTLSSQEEEQFCTKREIVREKAKALQQKYMDLFGIKDDTKYVEIFKQRHRSFQDSVSNLTEDQISLLIHDPSGKKIVQKKVPSPPS